MHKIEADTITLTLKYIKGTGIKVVDIQPSALTTLAIGQIVESPLELEWRTESTSAIATVKFGGDFDSVEVDTTLPWEKIVDHHYEVKYDSIPLAAGVVIDEPCVFALKLAQSGATSLSSASAGGSIRTAATRPRPEQLAGSLDVTPSTPGAKLVLLPTRKTSMPTHVQPPVRPIRRASP